MPQERRSGRDRRQNTAAYNKGADHRRHAERRHMTQGASKRPGGLVRFGLVTLILFLTISVNLPESMLVRLGLDPNALFAALFAVALSGMVMHKHIAVVVLVVLACIGANLPAGVADQYNINQDFMIATLIGIVILPFIKGWFE